MSISNCKHPYFRMINGKNCCVECGGVVQRVVCASCGHESNEVVVTVEDKSIGLQENKSKKQSQQTSQH